VRRLALFLLLVWTWILSVYHMGVLPPFKGLSLSGDVTWIDKSTMGIHQLVVSGNAYSRGWNAGKVTQGLLAREEKELTEKLFAFIPHSAVVALEVPLIRYFSGIEDYLDPWMLQEMFGVSHFAPHDYDSLIDPYTRQLVFHGLHEVGQMMVDQVGDNFGCTVVAAPFGNSWVLGRNFDFEGGPTLDREKIMKWTFPNEGLAYVSVIWAGMVGGVTGVNERGIYLSINAAGSADRRRFGLPTTLLLVKTLMRAHNAEEAIRFLSDQPTFITDIFVLLDSASGRLFRIEKSPLRTAVLELHGPSAVTNHLLAPEFQNDVINQFRQQELTTMARSQRAEKLLAALPVAHQARDLEQPLLNILRDKGDGSLPLGNRQAIDPLIATHGVLFNSAEQLLFVSQGPALVGPMLGFDLQASFRQRRPVVARQLPADPQVSEAIYEQVQAAQSMLKKVRRHLKKGDCTAAGAALETIEYREAGNYFEARGDFARKCQADKPAALRDWQKALALHPAYLSERRLLEKKISEVQ
jgi:hypothetical protein